ncbi:ComEC/Rec2 family competence protein [Patescibacteria group bacterium]
MRSFLIKISIVCFLGGVFVFGKIPMEFLIGGIGVASLLCIKKRVYLITILFFGLGLVRMIFAYPTLNDVSIHFYQNEEELRVIQGVIIENPDRRRTKANYILQSERILINDHWQDVGGRFLFSMDLYPEFEYGDVVEVKGRLVEPMEFDTFSYKNYLLLFDVHSVMYFPRITKLDSGKGSMFFSFLFDLKKGFEEQLNKLVPEPMASFEAGLLTGSRKGIPDELMQNFNLTGLTHIIAISGYNISLIIVLISGLFKNVARNVKIPIIICFIVVFTLFVGASAAVVRASIMGVIAVIALWTGRQSQILNALLMSAFVMTFMNPFTLLYDVGFQLSFLATMGLILTGNHLEKLFKFLPGSFGLREAFAMTFSAQIFALPVILYNFKRLSIISPVANVLVVPFIPFAMLFGFFGVVVSYFWFDLGFILIFPAWLCLKYIVFITELLANLPFASFETPWFTIFWLFGYYLFCVLFSNFIYPNFRKILLFVSRF